MRNRKYVYRDLEEMAKELCAFREFCKVVKYSAIPEATVANNVPALAALLPKTGEIIKDWLERLRALEMDLYYRRRALIAETKLRRMQKWKHRII
jgi:hypothetical protein